MKMLNTLNPLLNVLAAVIIVLSYVYTTFATKNEVKQYVDQKHDLAMGILVQIRDDVKAIDKKVWELSKERRK